MDCKVHVKVKHKYNISIWRKSKIDSVIINLTVLAHRLFIDVDVHYYKCMSSDEFSFFKKKIKTFLYLHDIK